MIMGQKSGFLKKLNKHNSFSDRQIKDRKLAEIRHDLDSGIFQGRYVNFNLGRFTDEFIYGRYQIFEEVKCDLRNLKPNSKVLDLGCGTGHLSQFIKEQGHEVIGLDPSKEMLKYAKKNFPDITFLDGISAELPFADNSFDYIVSIEVLRYLNKKDVIQTYQEIYRVLKTNCFFNATQVNKYATDFYYFYYHFIKFLHFSSGKNYHNCYFTTPKEEVENLKNANFKKISIKGRMFASIRIVYKFGKLFGFGKILGRSYSHFVELVNKTQEFKWFYKKFAGHLIVRGFK